MKHVFVNSKNLLLDAYVDVVFSFPFYNRLTVFVFCLFLNVSLSLCLFYAAINMLGLSAHFCCCSSLSHAQTQTFF